MAAPSCRPVRTEFRQAVVPADLRALTAFDRKIFPADHFPAAQWRHYESYWLLIDDRKVGCCAFERHVDFADDLREDGINPRLAGSLYIASTGILPKFRRMGLGQLMKAWQISYARLSGFSRIVTNTRKRNNAMLSLNRKFGFRVVRITPRYYRNPTDATVVMELRF